jgi:putative spermidine/putrescine transport system ATP-binding protein
MSFLVLDRLAKAYGDTIALDGLSLSVERGEFLSLLGPSGCGKTTTLQMIAGFVEPSAGAITLDGSDLLAVKPSRRGIGIVFQSYALFPHMTAAQNVAFGLEAQGVKRAERDKRVAEALALVGLSAFAERYPRKLSGGQQQRVALARALVIRPRLLLLDEPLSNLDAKLREEMQIELRQIQRRIGTTTILVTHDQAEALALSDRIVVMNKGRAEQIARPDEAYENPSSHFVAGFLGKTNVLPAEVREAGDGLLVTVGGADWRVATAAFLGPATISVRPERISFAAASGLAGIVRNRVFHGAQWLLQLDSAAGAVTVIRQNDGTPVPLEGERVVMTWRSADMHITAPAGTRAA